MGTRELRETGGSLSFFHAGFEQKGARMGFEKVLNKASANKPVIFFATGIVCVIAEGVLAYRAGKHLPAIIDDIAEEEDRKVMLKRIVKEAVPVAAPPVIFATGAITSFGLGQRELMRRASALATAYSMSEKALSTYQEKVIEKFGEEGHKAVQELADAEVPQDVKEKAEGYLTDADVANVLPHDIGDRLYYDREMNTLFWSTEQKIIDAESAINKQLIDTQIASVNDFYAYLNLEVCRVGDAIGWDAAKGNRARSLDVRFGSKRDEDMSMALDTISYNWDVVYPQNIKK